MPSLFARRLASVAGILSPLLLGVTVAAVASQRPEYSHLHDAISELGAVGRPEAMLMNLLGIIPSGLLTMAAAPAIYETFGKGRLSRAGEIVLVIAGACLVGTAVFAWTGAPNDLSNLNNKLHLVLALSGFFLLALAPLLFGLQLRRKSEQRSLLLFSLATSLAVFLLGFILPRPPYLGLFQRGALLAFFAWLVAMSVKSFEAVATDDGR